MCLCIAGTTLEYQLLSKTFELDNKEGGIDFDFYLSLCEFLTDFINLLVSLVSLGHIYKTFPS